MAGRDLREPNHSHPLIGLVKSKCNIATCDIFFDSRLLILVTVDQFSFIKTVRNVNMLPVESSKAQHPIFS